MARENNSEFLQNQEYELCDERFIQQGSGDSTAQT